MLTPSLSNCLLVRRWYIILSYIFLSSFTVRGQIRDTKTDFVIFVEDSTFEDAILYCKEKGGFLPSISNETDRNRLTEFVKQVNMNDKTFWLGISDRNKERLFESVNGEVVPFLPSFWAAGEPDNGGGTEPTCAKLQKEIDSELYLLKDTACGKYHYGICEIVKGDNGCENMHEDYCYELLEALRRSFSDSDAACQKWYNGRLAKVANLDKLLYFSELILEKGKENEDYWIGLTDGDRKGLWKFMDGNEAPFVPELWFNNEPNNNNRDYQDEDCVVATVTKDKLLFEDRKCSDSYNFICVIKSATTTTPAITTTTVVSTKTTTEPLKSTTTVSPISTTRERTTAVASPTTPQKSRKTTTQISTSGKTTTQRPTSIETTTQRPTSTKTTTKTSKSSKSTTQASANNETTTQASSAKTTTQTSTNNTTDASTTAILTSNTNAPSSKKTTSSSDKATSVQMTKTSSRETSSSTVGTQLESTSTKQKTSNTETVPQKTTTTTENTTTPEPVTTTVPPSPPTVPPTDSNDTSYEVTANYHIPNLKENGTSAVPEKAPLLSHGPLGFGYSVKVEESCLKFEDFEHEGDEDCWKNPSNCNKGVSLSIWERISFQRNDSTRRYIFSTGGKDEGIPGISLYYEGITLHALVSTGQEKWYTYAKGHLRNDTWNNIGIRWSQDSGLHVYVDAIHKAYVVYPEKTSGSVSSFQKTQLTVGCSRQEENAYVDYANGEFDEFAAWMWELERNEIAYFLGGFNKNTTCDPEIHPLKCETIPQSLKKTIETVDLNDMQVYDDSVKLLKDVSATIDENANELSEDGGSQDQSSGGTSSSGSSSNSENRIEKQQKVQEDMEAMSDIVKMVMQKTAVEPGISRNLSQNDLVNTYKFQDILSNLIGAYVNKREKVTQEDKQNIQALVQMYNKWALDKIGQTTYEKDAIDVLAISDNMVTESRKSNYKQLKQLVDETEHYFKFPGSSDSWDKVKEKWDSPEDYLSFPVDIFGDLDMSKEVHVIFTMQNIYHKIAPLSNKITGADPSLILLDSRILSFNVDPPHSDIVLQKSPIKCYLEHNYKRPSTGRKLLADTYLMTNGEIQKRYCVRWDEHLEIPGQSSKGGWTYEGCFTVNSTAESTECHCTRPGQYAVMAKLHKPFSIPPDPEWVKFLKWVLYGISGILLVVYIFTILFRRGLQEQFHLIRLNTALMATGALASFFASDWKRDDEEACRLLSGFIHFFYIAVASWFAIEAHALFSAIINGSVGGKLKCYIPIGYGIPGVILGVSIGIYPEYGYDYRCLVGPTCEMKWLLIGPILALGGITLIWSLITVCNLSTPAIKKHVVVLVLSAGTRALCVVSFLFVVTWIFGMLSFIDLGLDYEKTPDFTPIFQIMNSLLGVFIVVMMGFGSPHFRSALCSRGRSGGVLKRNQVDPFDLHDKAEIPKARKTFAA